MIGILQNQAKLMQINIIIILCLLLLLSYIFDITSGKTKIPTVILLLLLGWCVRQLATYFNAQITDLSPWLPLLGTIGLILIVLEGSLELELSQSNFKLIVQSAIMALVPLLLLSLGIAFAFHYALGTPLKTGFTNALPFSVISSSIAIPSARNFSKPDREFVTYESSLSDIFGVILFNFFSINNTIDFSATGMFVLEMAVILLISFIATIALAWLLKNIRHHVKFAPIILLVILIYALAKLLHLPALVFILIFGLVLGNLEGFKRYRIVQMLNPAILRREVHRFKEITIEATFLIRTLFFLLFGFLIETKDLFNGKTFIWAICIVIGIFLVRAIFLKILGLKAKPLLFMAPRGLITILLFLSIPQGDVVSIADTSLLIQVVVLSAIVMMVGSFMGNKVDSPAPI